MNAAYVPKISDVPKKLTQIQYAFLLFINLANPCFLKIAISYSFIVSLLRISRHFIWEFHCLGKTELLSYPLLSIQYYVGPLIQNDIVAHRTSFILCRSFDFTYVTGKTDLLPRPISGWDISIMGNIAVTRYTGNIFIEVPLV